MPKKTRKAKIRASQRPINAGYTPVATAPTSTETLEPTGETFTPRAAPRPAPVIGRTMPQITYDYAYVYRDLRRIGLLALTFFVLMFVLWYLVEVQGIHLIPGLL